MDFLPVEWLQLLPPKYLALLALITSVMAGASVLSRQIKKYAGVVEPNSRLGKTLRALDWIGRNSTPVHVKVELAQQKQEIASQYGRLVAQHSTIATAQAAIDSKDRIIDQHIEMLQTQANVIVALQKTGPEK